MLRRLDVGGPWRSLGPGFLPEDLPLARKTIVYGHNGSGKSTLSELLLSLAEGSAATGVTWEDESRHRASISPGGAAPSPFMAVFTGRWVDANLSAFLDGESASAIVTLGKDAIEAKEEEARLVDEVSRLRAEAKEADKQLQAAVGLVDQLSRDVQARIVSELKAFDYEHFTKNRYSVPKVQDDLRKYKGSFPDSDSHAEALKCLGEGAPISLPNIIDPPSGISSQLAELAGILAETPTRVAIQTLATNPSGQTWVEHGLALHEWLDHCLFCAAEIKEARREQLTRHFDESWLQIRSRAKSLRAAVTDERKALADWYSALPAAMSLIGDPRTEYEAAILRVKLQVDERAAVLQAVEDVLDVKIADPDATPKAPECSLFSAAASATVLAQAIVKHNDQVQRHAEVTFERKQTVLNHLVGSKGETFRQLEASVNELATKRDVANEAAGQAERNLNESRQAQFTTKDMADTLTRDLARVYGKDHLSVAVTPDGKSYECRRGDKPGTDLSHGERTTLSLLYFLRKLEEEQVPTRDASQRIVVIDDPSSSLDREALFATHQWLIDSLGDVGQYIILTHDFGLLRLFVKSQKSAWKRSMDRIKSGDANESFFPKVAFLEMYSAMVDGERRTKVSHLSRVLLNNTSEYAYLFAMVMAGIADPEDQERLFLLPNAARRVLEVFASYKAPHCSQFMQQLEVLVQSPEGEPYRDVYDFCNRYSHGEGSESIDVLDARAVHGQIRRSMEFLRSVDAEHFERMCMATHTERAILASGV